MRNVGGENYGTIMADPNHEFVTKIEIAGYEYAQREIFSCETDRAMFDKNMEIGKAVSAQIDVSMVNPDPSTNPNAGPVPSMARVIPYVKATAEIVSSTTASIEDGILDLGSEATIESDIIVFGSNVNFSGDYIMFGEGLLESEWIKMGVFYIDTRQVTHNRDGLDVLTFHGYDRMLFASEQFSDNSDGANGPAYTAAINKYREYYEAVHGSPPEDYSWPSDGISDAIMVEAIASVLGSGFDGSGVLVDERTWDTMLDGVSGSSVAEKMLNGHYKMFVPIGYTYREILGYIASAYVGSFLITEEEELRLVTYIELPQETYFLVDESGNTILVGGFRIKLSPD